MERLALYIPKLEELWFYQKMMSDPETMSYNDPWGGCINFPKEEWADWYDWWIGQEPKRFYAYIRRCSDDAWIGDVNFHYTEEKEWYDMGIVLYAPYRGKGYAYPALKLLLDHAFRDCGISRLHNDFEDTRSAALHIHRKAGFKEMGVENGIIHLMITREDYLGGEGYTAIGLENAYESNRKELVMPEIRFELAEEKDAATIIELRQKIWSTTYRGIYPDSMIDDFDYDWHREKELQRIRDPRYAVWLIVKNDLAVGYLIMRKADVMTLQSLYIVSEYQHQGIGRAAFDFIKQYCMKNHASTFICHCVPENAGAREFYERMGGTLIGEDMDNAESWINSVVYRFETEN